MSTHGLAGEAAITLRRAGLHDLEALNAVITAAIMTWDIPARVKRLAIPSYHYQPLDLQHMVIWVAENARGEMIGVAAWEDAPPREVPAGQRGLLLHGIFVHPEQQHQGIGRRLFAQAEAAARQSHLHGLLVKAQSDATGFFLAQGMEKIPAADQQRDFENRFWKTMHR